MRVNLDTLARMGNDSLVLWLSAELALAYFVAVLVAMVGVLQLVAMRWGRDDLQWAPRPWARFISLALILGALAWFYLGYYRLIFVPGPAGLELILLFGAATAIAVWVTRALHWLSGAARRETRVVGR